MKYERHGVSIGIERISDHLFLSLKAQGKLTHKDYETITPMIDSALAEVKDSKVRAIFDATEFEGWDVRAAWDDFKLGLKHGNEFEKIAIYSNKDWQELAAKVGSWFISGKIKSFNDCDEAIKWLHE